MPNINENADTAMRLESIKGTVQPAHIRNIEEYMNASDAHIEYLEGKLGKARERIIELENERDEQEREK